MVEIGDRGGPLRQHANRPFPFRPAVVVKGEVRQRESQTGHAFPVVQDLHQLVEQLDRAAQFPEVIDDRFDDVLAVRAIHEVVLRAAAQQPQRLQRDVSRHLVGPVEQGILREAEGTLLREFFLQAVLNRPSGPAEVVELLDVRFLVDEPRVLAEERECLQRCRDAADRQPSPTWRSFPCGRRSSTCRGPASGSSICRPRSGPTSRAAGGSSSTARGTRGRCGTRRHRGTRWLCRPGDVPACRA